MNILVTGVGGGVGQGIIKSLKLISGLNIRIIAADMSEKAAGLYAADVTYLVESCKSENYLKTLENIFRTESINYYFPGTDVELVFCAQHKQLIEERYGVHTVISSLETISIADNKFKTAQFLKDNNFPHPHTILASQANTQSIQLPVIIKPAVGCRSIGVYVANTKTELERYIAAPEGIVVQELIGTDDSEYTCTIVKVNNELSPVVVLKRTLRSGDTFRAEPVKSEIIERYVTDVASKLDIDGGCNFQLRIDKDGVPKIFEINSRYSGTTPFCSQIGFNPLEFYLKKRHGLEYKFKINYDAIVLRYWSEVVVPKSQLTALSQEKTHTPQLDSQFNLFG